LRWANAFSICCPSWAGNLHRFVFRLVDVGIVSGVVEVVAEGAVYLELIVVLVGAVALLPFGFLNRLASTPVTGVPVCCWKLLLLLLVTSSGACWGGCKKQKTHKRSTNFSNTSYGPTHCGEKTFLCQFVNWPGPDSGAGSLKQIGHARASINEIRFS
jgi:hypothetical protein